MKRKSVQTKVQSIYNLETNWCCDWGIVLNQSYVSTKIRAFRRWLVALTWFISRRFFFFFFFCGCGLDSFDPPSPSFPPCVPPPLPIHPSPSNKTEIRHKSMSGSKSHPLPFENKYPCPLSFNMSSKITNVVRKKQRLSRYKTMGTGEAVYHSARGRSKKEG